MPYFKWCSIFLRRSFIMIIIESLLFRFTGFSCRFTDSRVSRQRSRSSECYLLGYVISSMIQAEEWDGTARQKRGGHGCHIRCLNVTATNTSYTRINSESALCFFQQETDIAAGLFQRIPFGWFNPVSCPALFRLTGSWKYSFCSMCSQLWGLLTVITSFTYVLRSDQSPREVHAWVLW